MGIKDYLFKKKYRKLRDGYIRGTSEALEIGSKSGNPFFLHVVHPVSGISPKEYLENEAGVKLVNTPYGLCIDGEEKIMTRVDDLYFHRDSENTDYTLCDIHSLGFVARMIGRGIQITSGTYIDNLGITIENLQEKLDNQVPFHQEFEA